MTVLEILKVATYYLDKTQDFASFLGEGGSPASEETTKNWHKLLQAFNNIIGELATNNVFFRTVEEVNLEEDFSFDLSKLKNKINKVLCVRNGEKKLSYNEEKDRIVVKEILKDQNKTSNNGNLKVKIDYSFVPKIFTASDSLELSNISIRALALGVCSEYLFIEGVLDDAYAFREMFDKALDKIVLASIPLKNGRW